MVLYDDVSTTRDGDLNRDELLLFTVSLRAVRPIDYEGEGQEYESQFRIGEDHTGTALWQRRDAVLDEWCDAGGIASPVANGIISLEIQAYDGESWFDEWDSDIDGLPWALRVSVTASGNELGVDPLEDGIPQVTLRTQIAIDRIIPPPPEEEDDEEDDSSESTDEDATEENQSIESSPSAGGRPSNGGRPGSSVNQPGRGDNSIGSGGSRGNSGSQGGIDRE
ncbi:MAG: hypothetical protein CBC35_01320 [Planctomycetes bacterium TMED75]|nr:hypothetical protein [Planctomycetaceae bacterium]OUU96442.1 MAG: hypothetical protein CBC35_01320 [Planctomycetes bacterium TMED75]